MFWSKQSRFLLKYTITILILVLACALALRMFIVTSYSVQTSSMFPTLKAGEFLVGLRRFEPRRGDVVVLHCPDNPRQECLKRIVGLPGDRLEITKQRLFLNDRPAHYEAIEEGARGAILREAVHGRSWQILIGPGTPMDMSPVVVPPDTVFVLSDNRSVTRDSRKWGPVPASLLESKGWFRWLSIDWVKGRVNWHRMLRTLD